MFMGELHCLHNGFLQTESQRNDANELFTKGELDTFVKVLAHD